MIIIRNDLKWLMLLLTCFVLLLLSSRCHCSLFTENRICTSISHTHYYLKMGDVAIVSHGGESETPDAANNASLPAPDRCYVKFLTCHSCHLAISADYLEMAHCAENNSFSCDHIVIREPDYESSLVEFYSTLSNTSKIYESQTKILYIEYFSMSFSSNFSLTVKSLRNAYEIKGHTLSYRWNYTGTIQSPHFPLNYPSDYTVEYLVKNLDKKGFVQLIFSDFILSPYSFVEIYDSNGTKIDFYNGNSFRPPVITSSGPNLTVNFKANDESPNIGFRANYFFIGFYGKHLIYPPISDCGGIVEDHGGTITLNNMVAYDSQQAYDCVWIIRPRVFGHDTHLAVKVVQFEHMEPGSTLRIHEGLTSQSYLLETISSNRSRMGATHSLEYVVHVATGFYIRLQGYFTNESKIAIVYSSFRYDTCIPVKDFQCRNGRCIRPILHCDAYSHCGDGSDEISCFGHAGTISPEDAIWWRTLTPNYYFPKQESSSGAGTNTLILITSLAGLGMFILTTALILVKLHKQKRDDAINREVLSTISADIDSSSSSLRSNFGTPSEPPVYDPPPSYEDVVKFYFPPPPTYTSAVSVSQSGTTQVPSNVQCFHSGVENAAFIPDSQNRASHPANSATQRMFLSPPLLTVILPASRLLGLNPNRDSSNSSENNMANIVPGAARSHTKEDKQSSHKEISDFKDLSANSSHSSTTESLNLMAVDEELEKDTLKNELPLPSYESACNVASSTEICTCVGACACSISIESHSICPENGNSSYDNGKLPAFIENCVREESPTTSATVDIDDDKEANRNEDFRFSSNCEDEDQILHL